MWPPSNVGKGAILISHKLGSSSSHLQIDSARGNIALGSTHITHQQLSSYIVIVLTLRWVSWSNCGCYSRTSGVCSSRTSCACYSRTSCAFCSRTSCASSSWRVVAATVGLLWDLQGTKRHSYNYRSS